jgi:hypothetical protein
MPKQVADDDQKIATANMNMENRIKLRTVLASRLCSNTTPACCMQVNPSACSRADPKRLLHHVGDAIPLLFETLVLFVNLQCVSRLNAAEVA